MRICRFCLVLTSVIAALAVSALRAEQPKQEIEYAKQIQPILTTHCVKCHGRVTAEAGLRLTDLESSTLKLDSGNRAIVPKDVTASELVRRITSSDVDLRMPPPDESKLSAAEIELLKSWIAQGAKWPKHWAFLPLSKAPLPFIKSENAKWIRTPIDRFVLRKLLGKGFKPNKEANRRTLIRRVYFDLIGLPPSPREIASFLRDKSPNAYEKVVDRLLLSPRYGERWARHWQDLVHFADTHGHDEDAIRENAWPYRDYLIDSFNIDKPYADFVREQIAGDVLFPENPDGVVAIGMLAAGPWDESSQMGIKDGTVDKEIARYLERDDMIATVMNTFVSMTVHCARCHDHKFDPISTEEYYNLQSIFAGLDRVERPYDRDVEVFEKRRELLRIKSELENNRFPTDQLLKADVQSRVAKWEAKFRETGDWQIINAESIKSSGGQKYSKNADGSILFTGKRPEKDTYTISGRVNLPKITAVRLEVLTDDSLHQKGPGRQDNGNLHLSEFKLSVQIASEQEQPIELHKPAADFNQSGWTIAHALDGNPKTAWGIFPQVGQPHSAVFQLKKPIESKEAVTLKFTLEQLHGGFHLIGRPRLSVTSSPNPRISDSPPKSVHEILSVDADTRSDSQKVELANYVLKRENAAALSALPKQSMVYSVATDFKRMGNFVPAKGPRPVKVLRRGNVLTPIKPASPGALSCVENLNSKFSIKDARNEGERRAKLADWISAKENVLTWRSIVNRVWHYHFGSGIVSTPSDFGTNGSPPTHPELLDWLAVEFRDNGGTFKWLHRIIVTSATYRQSTLHNWKFAAIDRDNRYLWRMNRRKLDAEQVRDAVLKISGRIDNSMGGPPDRQFLASKGIHVTPTLDYDGFNVDSAAARRRSVYRFVFRTVPDPLMEALDCPDASQFTPKRTSSVTSLQALAMLNNRFIVRYCEHIANRFENQFDDPKSRIQHLFEWAYGRPPTEIELDAVNKYVEKHGLANTCRIVVNSNEFMFVN